MAAPSLWKAKPRPRLKAKARPRLVAYGQKKLSLLKATLPRIFSHELSLLKASRLAQRPQVGAGGGGGGDAAQSSAVFYIECG